MHRIDRSRTMLGAAVALLLLAAPAKAEPLTVVELFTSQGCSSCPPANANLVTLSTRKDVLALSFGVTYWDYLGWKDSFAKEEFTDRQRIYEPALGRDGPFTPQVVVDGQRDTVGNRLGDIESLLGTGLQKGPEVTLSEAAVTIGGGTAPEGGADVWLVAYRPGTVEVPVKRGENTGRTLPHANVVTSVKHLGRWTGKAARFDLPGAASGLATAVLVQGKQGGPILAAATDQAMAGG